MATRSDMVHAGEEAVRLGVKYVYGAKPSKGEFIRYSRADIKLLQDLYGTDMVWPSDLNKAGNFCCDCSGLMTYATGEVVGSYYLREDAVARYSIADLWSSWKKYIGMVLWMPGHVGIVSDQYGMYYALDGSARNSVHNPMRMQNWKEVLQIRGVDYSEEVDMRPADVWEYNYKNSAPGGNMYNCMLQIHAQVTALNAAVKALAEAKGANPDAIAKSVDAAVKARLEKIKLNVDAG